MSPIQAIKDWYVSLDNELQSDIAYMFVSLTLGDRQFAPAAAVRRLLQWFDVRSEGTEHEDALAAVTFRPHSNTSLLSASRAPGGSFRSKLSRT